MSGFKQKIFHMFLLLFVKIFQSPWLVLFWHQMQSDIIGHDLLWFHVRSDQSAQSNKVRQGSWHNLTWSRMIYMKKKISEQFRSDQIRSDQIGSDLKSCQVRSDQMQADNGRSGQMIKIRSFKSSYFWNHYSTIPDASSKIKMQCSLDSRSVKVFKFCSIVQCSEKNHICKLIA